MEKFTAWYCKNCYLYGIVPTEEGIDVFEAVERIREDHDNNTVRTPCEFETKNIRISLVKFED